MKALTGLLTYAAITAAGLTAVVLVAEDGALRLFVLLGLILLVHVLSYTQGHAHGWAAGDAYGRKAEWLRKKVG